MTSVTRMTRMTRMTRNRILAAQLGYPRDWKTTTIE